MLTSPIRLLSIIKILVKTQNLSIGLLLSSRAELSRGLDRRKKSKPRERKKTKKPLAVSSVRASNFSTTRQPPKAAQLPSSVRKPTCFDE